MRTVNWADRSVYRITKIVFRQHIPWNSFDVMEAEGLDNRGKPVALEIYNAPFRVGRGGLIEWLINKALADGVEECVLVEQSKIYIWNNLAGSTPIVTELTA